MIEKLIIIVSSTLSVIGHNLVLFMSKNEKIPKVVTKQY